MVSAILNRNEVVGIIFNRFIVTRKEEQYSYEDPRLLIAIQPNTDQSIFRSPPVEQLNVYLLIQGIRLSVAGKHKAKYDLRLSSASFNASIIPSRNDLTRFSDIRIPMQLNADLQVCDAPSNMNELLSFRPFSNLTWCVPKVFTARVSTMTRLSHPLVLIWNFLRNMTPL